MAKTAKFHADSQERLLTAARTRLPERYLRLLCHEISNPLTVMFGEACQLRDLTHDGRISNQQVLTSSEVLERMSLRMVGLMREMRTILAMEEDGQAQIFPLIEIYEPLIARAQRLGSLHDTNLDFSRPQPGVLVCGHRSQLTRILWQILTNAIDATCERKQGRHVAVEIHIRDKTLEIRIQDNGPGLSDEIKARLFEPFVSDKDPSQRCGLGLFASRCLAEQNEGRILVEENPTAFTLQLPRVE
jgi:signal transduction histidine kinase